MDGLHIHGVHHAYGDTEVLRGISLTVPAGELVCLLGPSGCGKTTLLRLAAGLERLQQGSIAIDEEVVAGDGVKVLPEHRRVGYMFQDYALFPHLNVTDNILFGLFRWSTDKAKARVAEVLSQVGMEHHALKFPHTLSGGQQQRVALARAIAPEPRLVLLDEPFSGLDTSMRVRVREQTLNVLKQAGVATLMVTHDPQEAMYMADRIKVMGAGGQVLQSGRPHEIYYKPVDEYVARLFGPVNEISSTVSAGVVSTPFGAIPANGFAEGTNVKVLIRPESFRLLRDRAGSDGCGIDVVASHLLGDSTLVEFGLAGLSDHNGAQTWKVQIPGNFDPANHVDVGIALAPEDAFVFREFDGHQG
jgi:iron(III) transport system ATP-binding protein